MANEVVYGKKFNDDVAQDRATKIREAAKNNKRQSKKKNIEQVASAISGKASKKALDKIFLNFNNGIWSLTLYVVPLLGLTFILSFLLVLALVMEKFFASRLKEKGISVEISMITKMYTWGSMVVHLFITLIIYFLIYIMLNPMDFALEALGL
jgi:hypothetical protein